MIATKICAECGRLLTDAQQAMRNHETDLLLGLKLNFEGYLTEELREQLAPEVVESFNATQAAWDAYRKHLGGHGLLEVAAKSRTAR